MKGIRLSLEQLIQLRRQAQSLKLSSRYRMVHYQVGNHQAALRGRGLDFDEVRGYQAGDDMRSMDWRVTARTGEPHIKLYREERERPVYLIIDLSPSMYFGTRVTFKSSLAIQAAALLGWAAIHNGDRVGALVFFSSEEHWESRAQTRHEAFMPLLKTLAEQSDRMPQNPDDPAALSNTLSHARHVAKHGSLIFILSDFQTMDQDTERHLSQLSQHNEIIAIHISDPLEQSLPAPGCYPISDGQNVFSLNTYQKAYCNAYAAQFAEHHEYLKKVLNAQRIPLIELSTEHDVYQRLYTRLRKE